MEEKFTPVKDYAAKNKCSIQHVYKQIRDGKLESKKIGSFILVKTV